MILYFLEDEAGNLGHFEHVFHGDKHRIRVSYKTVLSGLIEYGDADNSIWKKFNIAYQRRFNRRLSFKKEPMGMDAAEPFGMQRFDFFEDRFSRLTREVVEKDKISLSRS